MGDRAFADADDLVRAVRPQPGRAVRAYRVLHARAPAQAGAWLPGTGPLAAGTLVAGQGLDRDLVVQARQPPELLADHGGLEVPLGGQRGVLPVAAAAAARAGVRARRLDPVRGRGEDLHRLGPGEPRRDLGDPGHDRLARQRVPDEHHRPVLRPGDAPAAVGHVRSGQLDDLAGLIVHRLVNPLRGRGEIARLQEGEDAGRGHTFVVLV